MNSYFSELRQAGAGSIYKLVDDLEDLYRKGDDEAFSLANIIKRNNPNDGTREPRPPGEIFVRRHIAARGLSCLLIPGSFVTHAISTIAGLGAAAVAAVTGGHCKPAAKAFSHLNQSQDLLANPYKHLLRTINPQALTGAKRRFFHDTIARTVEGFAAKLSRANFWPIAHGASRLAYAVLAVAYLVTSVADGLIGVAAASVSLAFLGRWEAANAMAYSHLQATSVIRNIAYCTIKIINPHALLGSEWWYMAI